MRISLSLKARLLLQCAFMALVIATTSLCAYLSLENINRKNQEIVDETVPSLTLLNTMGLYFKQVRIEVITLGLAGISKEDAYIAIQNANEAIGKYEDAQKTYSKVKFSEGEKKLSEDLHKHWEIFKEIGKRALTLSQSTKPEDKELLIKLILVECLEAARGYNESFEKLLAFNKHDFTKIGAISKSIAHTANATILAISLIGTMSSLVVGFILATKLSNTFNKIAQSLKGIADEVASASVHIATSSEELSQTTSDQASSLQETSSSIEEINLMSGQASLEITNMLASSIHKVEGIVKNSEQRIGKLVAEGKISVEAGTRVANQCGEVLKEIVTSVATVSNAVMEISSASQEQTQGVQEVTKAIAQLDQVTQENNTNSASSATAATSLSNQAKTLSQLVADLVSSVDGKSRAQIPQGEVAKKVEKTAKIYELPKNKKASINDLFPKAQDSRFSDV